MLTISDVNKILKFRGCKFRAGHYNNSCLLEFIADLDYTGRVPEPITLRDLRRMHGDDIHERIDYLNKCKSRFIGQRSDGTQHFEAYIGTRVVADVYMYPVHHMYFGFDRATGAMILDDKGEPAQFAAAAWAGNHIISKEL